MDFWATLSVAKTIHKMTIRVTEILKIGFIELSIQLTLTFFKNGIKPHKKKGLIACATNPDSLNE
jgi:hypothetical protein